MQQTAGMVGQITNNCTALYRIIWKENGKISEFSGEILKPWNVKLLLPKSSYDSFELVEKF